MTEIQAAKKIAEVSKKLDTAKRKTEQYRKYLESDIKAGRETTNTRIDLEYAIKKQASLQKELDSLT